MENKKNENIKEDQHSNIIQSSNPKPERISIIKLLKRKFVDIDDDTYSTDLTKLWLNNNIRKMGNA